MYIPTTYFSSQGSCFRVTTSTISGSSLITTGSFTSGGIDWDYWKFETTDFTDSNLTALTASFNILSGSTGRAKLLIVGGGGTGTDGNTTSFTPTNSTITYDVITAGGGGGGGVLYYDNFPLTSGSYEIGVANAVSGYILCGGCQGGTICGKTGNTSYIKLPNNLTYTPFTSSTLIAYGGGPGATQGQYLQISDKRTFFFNVPTTLSGSSALYANGGGAAGAPGFVLFPQGDRPSPGNSNFTTPSAGIGQGGIYLNNQGNDGAQWCGGGGAASGVTQGGGPGGGGAGSSPTDLGQGCAGVGVYVSNGGDGLSFNLTGTSIIVGNGGGGASENGASGGTQGIRGNSGASTYGSGGNGYKGTSTPTTGNGGVVIIAIPKCIYSSSVAPTGIIKPNIISGSILTAWQWAPNYTASATTWNDSNINNNNAQFRLGGGATGVTMSIADSGSSAASLIFNDNRIVYQTYPMNATPSSSFSLNVYGEFNSGSNFYPLFANAFADGNGWDFCLVPSGSTPYIQYGTTYSMPPSTIYTSINTSLTDNSIFTGSNLLTINVNTNAINQTGSIDVYLNGVLQSSSISASYVRRYNDGAGNNQFGAARISSTNLYLNNSKIKDTMIYNRTLTQSEILQNYNALVTASSL